MPAGPLLLILELKKTYSFQQLFYVQALGVVLTSRIKKKRVWIFLSLDQPEEQSSKISPAFFQQK